jgi:hypothetical protein
MFKIYLLVHLLLMALVLPFGSKAQILVSRNYLINPFTDSSSNVGKVFANTGFLAEFSRGYGSTADAHAWNAKIAGYFEVYRFNPKLSFIFVSAHEVTADLYNNLYFNPKGAIWHETFALYYQRKKFVLEAGITHRCRHNIDNADTDGSVDGSIDFQNITYRVLILNAPYLQIFQPAIPLHKKITLQTALRGEYFWYSYDSRYPYIDDRQSWATLRGAVQAQVGLNWQLNRTFGVYAKSWLQTMIFDTQQVFTHNARTELGVAVRGEKADLQVFGSYEYFFDDYSRHIPRSSGVIFVGARIGGKVFGL